MPWKKGQSGNPGGRSRKRRDLEELVRNAVEHTEGSNGCIDALSQIARGEDEDAKPSDIIRANEILLAYGWGKPTSHTEVTGKDGGPVEMTATRPEQLDRAQLLELAAKDTTASPEQLKRLAAAKGK